MNNNRRLVFYEHAGFLHNGELHEDLEISGLSETEISSLEEANKEFSGGPVFKFSRNKIRACSVVGVISLPDVQIDILPKLVTPGDSNEQIVVENLSLMLNLALGIDPGLVRSGFLHHTTGNLLELYIGIFSNSLQAALKLSLPQTYQTRTELLNRVKGKVLYSQDIKLNPFNRAQAVCQYDELSLDNPLTRAIRWVASYFQSRTRSQTTKELLSQSIARMGEVENSFISAKEFAALPRIRSNPSLNQVIDIVAMVLNNITTHGRSGNDRALCFLFDMNKLLEGFVVSILRRNSTQLGISKVTPQHHKPLVDSIVDMETQQRLSNSSFSTYSDVLLELQNGNQIIIDTKYKIVSFEASRGAGISSADLYQMLAYQTLHSQNLNIPAVILVYPQTSEALSIEIKINGGKTSVFAATLNLKVSLEENENMLAERFKSLFTLILREPRIAVGTENV